MKTLSLYQPWATLMVIGAKRIETRSWMSRYRGPLAIHSTKSFPAYAKNLCYGQPLALTMIAEEQLEKLTEQVALCACGQPRTHRGMCTARARKAAQTRASRLATFRELDRAIAESAEDFGADKRLRMAARVMIAGMWSRELDKLRIMTGYSARFVREVADRLTASRIWRDPDGVWLGELESESGDFQFWLNAMVAEGTMYTDDGGETYGLASWRQPK